jgi:hypothetical protein
MSTTVSTQEHHEHQITQVDDGVIEYRGLKVTQAGDAWFVEMVDRPDDMIDIFTTAAEARAEIDRVLDRRDRHQVGRMLNRGRHLLTSGWATVALLKHPDCDDCTLLTEESALVLEVNGPPTSAVTLFEGPHMARTERADHPGGLWLELGCLARDLPL